MRAGTISRIISYFFQNPKTEEDIDRALLEFFEAKSAEELYLVAPDLDDPDSPSHRCFHEWFVFDFKLSGGQTPLQEWREKNPENMPSSEMEVYAELLRDSEYGFFKVISSVPGRVEVENLATRKRYTVREYSAAPFLTPNEAIAARVGLVEGRYEFVGGRIDRTNTEFSERALKTFTRPNKPITLKEVYHLWHAPNRAKSPKTNMEETGEEKFFEIPEITVAEAKRRARKALKICDVLPFVSAERIAQWACGILKNDDFSLTTMLMGLASDEAKEEEVDELIRAAATLKSAVLDEESQKSGNALETESENAPRFHYDIIEPFKWNPVYYHGIEQMKKVNFKKALALFNKVFKYLLEEQTTTREVYRLFANKGVSMIAKGKPLEGRYFLELALKLNPNYDFAQQSLVRCDREFFAPRRKKGKKEDVSLNFLAQALAEMTTKRKNASKILGLENDPAQIYYVWLKRFNICFSKRATPTIDIAL